MDTVSIPMSESAEVQSTTTSYRDHDHDYDQKEANAFDFEGMTTNHIIIGILIILVCCIALVLCGGAVCYRVYRKRIASITDL